MSEALRARWQEATDQAKAAVQPPAWPAPCWHADLLRAYAFFDTFNQEHFARACPPVWLTVNTRLRRTLARVRPARRHIELSALVLEQVPAALGDLMYHEMVHLWLHSLGQPHGHTPAFRAKLAQRSPDVPRAELRLTWPGQERRVFYRCPNCAVAIGVRRRFGRPMACAACHRAGQGYHLLAECAAPESAASGVA